MHPLNNGSQVENVPALKPRVGTAGYFSESNESGSPSYPGQDWFNAVIREFQTALAASGVAFDPDKFDHLQKMITNASNGVRNLFEANQNFNVEGADGTLTSSEQTFTDGQEFSYGWFVTDGPDLVDVKIVDGEVTAASGKVQRAYPKDPAGLLTAANVYGSITAKNGERVYADTLLTNGLEVTEDASKIYLTIDFGVYVDGVAIVGLASARGVVSGISDVESMRGIPITLAENSLGWGNGSVIQIPDVSSFDFLIIKFSPILPTLQDQKIIKVTDYLNPIRVSLVDWYNRTGDSTTLRVAGQNATQFTVESVNVGSVSSTLKGVYGVKL